MKATLSLSIYILLLGFAAAAPLDSAAPTPAPGGGENDSEFIRTSCQSTLYPEICYNTMAPYASRVSQDRGRLARAAISLSLSGAKHMAAHFDNLSRLGADPDAAAALQDCSSAFSDSVDQMHDSLAQLKQLGGSGEALRFQMSNVQTWMSAAETNEDTCADGFEGVVDGPLKTDVCDRVTKVKQVTSNALALVNYFASNITAP
ncbi:21 kDa protein-like [Ipomoea triloba]|uniref:21 kDa protein-like n=1 Tax=Ipomoea triloba TaxID=35885 RepID=UPI00125E29CB|nr:21 kDa protein-like [Ipomoea triloba]